MGSSKSSTHSATDMGPWGPTQAPLTEQGIPRIEAGYNKLGANPLIPQAQAYTGDVLSGKFLDPNNPQLKSYMDVLGGDINSRLTAQMGMAGRGNLSGGDVQQNISRGMTAGLAQPLFQQYNVERGIQDQASRAAPAMASMDVMPTEWYTGQMSNLARLGQKGTTDSTTTTTPSMGQTLGGIGMMALSAMGAPGMGGAFSPGGAMSSQYGPPSPTSPASPWSQWKMPWQ